MACARLRFDLLGLDFSESLSFGGAPNHWAPGLADLIIKIKIKIKIKIRIKTKIQSPRAMALGAGDDNVLFLRRL